MNARASTVRGAARTRLAMAMALALATVSCDEACRDGIAVRGLRETMKLVYNLTVQGKPVGAQDASTPCPLGGSAHVAGDATSNSIQGASFVKLTYVLEQCAYLQKTDKPAESYSLVLTGTFKQEGTLAVQPSATTALVFSSDDATITGTVYDPPVGYTSGPCPLALGQNGNRVAGTLCGRTAATDL